VGRPLFLALYDYFKAKGGIYKLAFGARARRRSSRSRSRVHRGGPTARKALCSHPLSACAPPAGPKTFMIVSDPVIAKARPARGLRGPPSRLLA
jgi:hypothetical protein